MNSYTCMYILQVLCAHVHDKYFPMYSTIEMTWELWPWVELATNQTPTIEMKPYFIILTDVLFFHYTPSSLTLGVKVPTAVAFQVHQAVGLMDSQSSAIST